MSKTDSNQHQDNKIPSIPAGDFILFILFILLTGAMITPGILSPNPQNTLSFIALVVDIIIFFRLTAYLTNKNSLSIIVKKWVHYTQQCRVEVSRVMRSIIQNKWTIRTFVLALSFLASLTLAEHWKEIVSKITTVLEFFIIENKPLGISILITFIVTLIIFHKKIIATFQKFISGLTSKYFIFTLAGLAIIGALSALLIPSYTSWFREPGYTSAQHDSAKETPEKVQETPASTPSPTGNKAAEVEQKSTSDLRLHLLYIAGGIIAVLGLIETNRKNSQDHIREVHAARRDRYIQAVDKLSSEHAPVRLGGVYALVGLVDEWLDDDNIDKETQIKEGQIIINNLCSYIRSPFPLAEKIDEYEARKELEELKKQEPKNLSEDKSSRLKVLHERFKDSTEYEAPKDIAADRVQLRGEQDVRRAIFEEMSKRSSTFAKDNKGKIIDITSGPWSGFNFDFSRAPIFYPLNGLTIEQGQFSSARFYGDTNFVLVKFTRYASFMRAKFTGIANFGDAEFIIGADFGNTEFTRIADFGSAKFTGNAYFLGAKFAGNAYFWGAKFAGNANFRNAEFIIGANFGNAEFTRIADFGSAKFIRKAYFTDAEFTSNTNFNSAYFEKYVPTFADDIGSARFSSQRDQKDYVFSADQNGKPIDCEIATLDGKSLEIPLGAVLFDPGSWNEEEQKYDRVSKSATPLENSDTEEEKPAE